VRAGDDVMVRRLVLLVIVVAWLVVARVSAEGGGGGGSGDPVPDFILGYEFLDTHCGAVFQEAKKRVRCTPRFEYSRWEKIVFSGRHNINATLLAYSDARCQYDETILRTFVNGECTIQPTAPNHSEVWKWPTA
jgi:hypothetical protein